MRRSRIWVLPAAVLTLAACASSELDRSSTEACDTLAAWAAAGSPADQRDAVTTRIDDLLAESGTTPLTDPLERFRGTRESDLDYAAVVEAGANFLRACGDHGWQPAEG